MIGHILTFFRSIASDNSFCLVYLNVQNLTEKHDFELMGLNHNQKPIKNSLLSHSKDWKNAISHVQVTTERSEVSLFGFY